MTMLLSDQPARELISSRGLDRTLFVEAGAGTGKTTQLVSRIVNTVLHTDVRLSEIAAITFTEAAASELQARIRVEFEKQIQASNSTHRERAEQAIADTDLAAISTVHGFASRILGEFSVAAGLPPRISVLDEVASQLANEQRWDRFVDLLNNEPELEELMYRAALLDVPLSPAFHGQASFKDVAHNFAQNWDRLDELLDQSLGAVLAPIDFAPFQEAVRAVSTLLDDCLDHGDLLAGHLRTILPDMQAVVAIDDPHRALRRMQALHRRGRSSNGRRIIWGRGVGGAKKNWAVDPNDIKDIIDEANDALGVVLDKVSQGVLEQLMRLTAREVRQAANERKSNGGLEFHDLLVIARQMLRDNAEVRKALHERYQHVLLDEFQDTDPIQIELASLIAATPAEHQPPRWSDHPVAGGRLFFVGDPKQSIYRFRRADIKLFLEARDTFGAAGSGVVRLDTNFRTVPPIIDWVNGLFAEAMSDEIADAQPKYEPLSAGRSLESCADHRPVVLGGEHPDPKVKAGELRLAEATDVAGVVAAIRAEPEQWPVFDQRHQQWRPARLSDITILIPTRTSLPFLRDALSGHEIPSRLATGTLVYDTQEVRDTLAALRAIDDPNDTLSLIAALRSPLYGCSDVDLYAYHQAHRRWSLRNTVHEGFDQQHPVVTALAHLRTMWEQRWWTGPASMLERVLRERRGFLLGYGAERPAEVWRRLRFLVDQARAFEESNGGGLRAFLDWAALQSSEGSRVHEPMLPETDDEAVQIMTVHGSKGLEFPITILSGMTTASKGKQNGVSVLWGETGPPAIKLRAGVATAEHTTRADLEDEMDTHEKLRLLYVATTRARDHLIVSGHHKASNKAHATYATRLAMFSAANPELCRPFSATPIGPSAHGTVSAVDAGQVGEPMAERHRWIAARQNLLAPFLVPTVVSATAIARTVDAAMADSDDDTASATDELSGPTIVRKKGRAGSAIGRAVHATLEFVDFDEPLDLDALVQRQCELHAIVDYVDTVGALVRSALSSDVVALARTNTAFRELYVGAPVGDVMVEGYVDLLIQTPDGLVIVDYKTDSASSPAEIDAKLAAYELQGAAYAVVLEESTGLDVIDCRFVFCKVSGAIERSVVDLAGAKQRVRDTVAAGLQPAPGSMLGEAVSIDTMMQPSLFSD